MTLLINHADLSTVVAPNSDQPKMKLWSLANRHQNSRCSTFRPAEVWVILGPHKELEQSIAELINAWTSYSASEIFILILTMLYRLKKAALEIYLLYDIGHWIFNFIVINNFNLVQFGT